MRVRVVAACVFVGRGEQKYWTFLKTAAQDPDPAVRRQVALRLPDHPNRPLEEESVSLLLQLLTDEDMDVAGAAWEPLDKNLVVEGPWDWPPRNVEEARKMAEAFRKAWKESGQEK
jgi:hypothetical protein